MNYERVVELNRWPGIGFGFSVIGGSDTHIPPMICALVRDSPALLSKQVYVGDVLYKVNGINVTTLETKQVVDLIRNCKKSIVLTLKEDRLAKLKARPFLAEDTLIEPPRAAGTPPHHRHQQHQHQHSSRANPHQNYHHNDSRRTQQEHQRRHPEQPRSGVAQHPPYPNTATGAAKDSRSHEIQLNSRTRTVGSPKSYEYGTDGNYKYQPTNHHMPPNHIDLSSTYSYYSQRDPQSGSSSGSENRQNRISSRQDGFSGRQDGINSRQDGFSSRQDGFSGLQDGISSRQTVSCNLLDGNSGPRQPANPNQVRNYHSSHSSSIHISNNMDSKGSKTSLTVGGGGGGGDKRHNRHGSSSPPNTTVTAHLYTLDDVPLSPRYHSTQHSQSASASTAAPGDPGRNNTAGDTSYQCLVNKRQGDEYVSYRFGKNDYANVNTSNSETSIPLASQHYHHHHHHQQQQQHQQHQQHHPATNNYRQKMGKKYGSFDRLDYSGTSADHHRHHHKSQLSAPHYKTEGQFDFSDGSIQSCVSQHEQLTQPATTYAKLNYNNSNDSSHKNRPHSNPEILDVDTKDPDNVYNNSLSPQSGGGLKPHQQTSNYSSPNIYNDSERMHSEHKALTLTPVTHSVYSLAKPEQPPPSTSSPVYDKEETFLSPLSIATTPQSNSSVVSSSGVSPTSFLTESEFSGSASSTNQITKEEVSPADIASRLFTLNGYKDTDVAPLLGKNSDFSQQICKEYLRFFQFEGITLDEAIRSFLTKFPLTGETQERERILIHFSNRYHECNQITDMDADSVHTLVCACMLLNTDLHGHNISNRMTLNDFVTNLSGLCNGKDFPKEYLKTLYNSIKSKEIIFARAQNYDASPKPRRKNSAPGNPFIQLKVDSNDLLICEGLVYRKSVMDPGGRRTPLMRRNWRSFYCVLRGLVMLNYKPDSVTTHEPQSVGIHHALAGYAKDYKKRMFVFKVITADWSVYYIQVKNQDEVKTWMDSINVSAALLSSPPLPAPCGSSIRFQRPVMPISRTRLTPEQQLAHHTEKIDTIEKDLASHLEYRPNPSTKHYQDWENKNDYLEFELKRFMAYVSVLTLPKLSHIREKIIVHLNKDSSDSNKTATAPNGKLKTDKSFDVPRSSSMHSLSTLLNSETQQESHNENRMSYALGPP